MAKKAGTGTGTGTGSSGPCYTPRPCPKGDPHEMCEAINEWAKCLKIWADEVHMKLWPGGPGPVDPPPPPPFKP